MSEVDRDETTVSNDGITVRKSLDDDQFETLAIVFEVRSERDDPVTLRLVDRIPDGIKLDDVGFHPDYGAEYWEAKDENVVFEREFSETEEFTTIFGVREYTESQLESFLEDPEIELVEPVQPIAGQTASASEATSEQLEDVVSPEDSQAVREVIAGERESLPGLDETADYASETAHEPPIAEASTVDDEEQPDVDLEADDTPGPLDLDEPADPIDAPTTGAESDSAAEPMNDIEAAAHEALSDDAPSAVESSDSDASTKRDEITVPVTGGVGRVLAKELRAGTIDPEDKRLLRDELLAGETSTDARIKHLQNEVSDLVAYTDALEAFIDEQGTGQQLLDEFTEQVETLADSFERLETRLDETTETVSRIDRTVEELESDVNTLREDHPVIDELETTVDSLGSDITGIQNDIEELTSFRDRLSSAFGGQMDG